MPDSKLTHHRPVLYLGLAVMVVGVALIFWSITQTPHTIPVTSQAEQPTAVAVKIAKSLDEHPEDWEEALPGYQDLTNEKLNVTIDMGFHDNFHDDNAERVNVKIANVDMPALERKNGAPTASQLLVYEHVKFWWSLKNDALQRMNDANKQSIANSFLAAKE